VRRRELCALSCVLVACLASLTSTLVAQDSALATMPRAAVSVRVVPDSVAVGQPFLVTMRLVPPAQFTLTPPALPDTGGLVEPLDPAQVSKRGDTVFVRYRFLAWQPGVLSIPFGSAMLTSAERRVEQPVEARVVVVSVLPQDSAARIPKPTRSLLAAPQVWWMLWWRWVAAGALIIALALLLLAWLRKPRKRPAVIEASAIDAARGAFTRLRARELATMGEGGRHVVLGAEILRRYLETVSTELNAALSATELADRADSHHELDVDELRDILRSVDAIRFSGSTVQGTAATELVSRIEAFVSDTDRRTRQRVAEAA
jgi:hypothetical protein